MTFPSAADDRLETKRHRALLDAVVATPGTYPRNLFIGRGIVLCGGGNVYFTCAWVCIAVLRRLGCTLPIELWYRGPAEMNAAMLALMATHDVTCIDAYAVARCTPVHRLDSWELKPFAIVHSSFAEVLYLDADNLPVRDPAFLFDCPEYTATGALFWPDRYTGQGSAQEWVKRSAWKVCGVPYRVEPEIETGQLLIDKRRCWHALKIALHLNAQSDFYYAHFYGDKDTFRLAWHRAGQRFTLIAHAVVNLAGSAVMLQHDPDGGVLFQHRSGDKWGSRSQRVIPGFVHESTCRDILADLQVRWRGPVRAVPANYTPAERAAYDGICAAPWFRYALQGIGSRRLELCVDFTIGSGAGEMERRWELEQDKDGVVVLSLRSAEGPTCFLRCGPDGGWVGRWRAYDRYRVRLDPCANDDVRLDSAISQYRMRQASAPRRSPAARLKRVLNLALSAIRTGRV